MKRFVSGAVVFLVLFVAAASFARYADLERSEASPTGEMLIVGELPLSAPYESATTTNEPQVTSPNASNPSQDILLVNSDNPLPENYCPENLVRLYDQRNRQFQLANADIEVCEIVFAAMDAMFTAAQNDGVGGFIITSGYRSYEKQVEVFASSPAGIAAEPGKSEHETGLAFDVTAYGNENFELTPQYEWLSEHCAEYGFIIRYPNGKEDITGVPFEPWHYRYVGTPYAEEIMDAGITLEEYLEQQ